MDRPGRLPYDHGDIIAEAVKDIRSRYAAGAGPRPAARGRVHAARVTAHTRGRRRPDPLQRDKFRRTMEPQLVPTGTMTDGDPGPARGAFPAAPCPQVTDVIDPANVGRRGRWGCGARRCHRVVTAASGDQGAPRNPHTFRPDPSGPHPARAPHPPSELDPVGPAGRVFSDRGCPY